MNTALNGTKRHPRLPTIVWGSVILAIASLLLVSQVVELSVDPVIVALGLLVGVGLALVVGGILSLRSRQTENGREDHDDPLSGY
ncbi:hypothetical protein [Arthrobacter sp. L77]|uniref:hypothetical protein n=1 Tax=Arthrobacter sp. L77 TaxID=1496689 RepID=UPI0005BA0F36|nr:hypothetical protein [Arthrobacter sp. L77]